MWIAGLVNAFKHSQDAWSSVGSLGLTLSVVSTLAALVAGWVAYSGGRSEEHTSELQSLMRISYAVFCLKKKTREINQVILLYVYILHTTLSHSISTDYKS